MMHARTRFILFFVILGFTVGLFFWAGFYANCNYSGGYMDGNKCVNLEVVTVCESIRDGKYYKVNESELPDIKLFKTGV